VALLIVTGTAAGAINAAVGSGSLLTYPALLSIGIPPVIANGTNTVGVVPGAVSGAWVYRGYLRERHLDFRRWLVAISIGSLVGTMLVVVFPAKVFAAIVPWLILAACVSILVQPLILKWAKSSKHSERALTPAIGGVGIYAGYFGAALGIALLAVLGSLEGGDVHRSNAMKNALAVAANGVSGAVFILAGKVLIIPALIIGVSAMVGGLVGGGLAKRMPPAVLKAIILAVGLYAVVLSFSRV